MPTPTGGETKAERLHALRAQRAQILLHLERGLKTGQEFRIGGASVTLIAREQAQRELQKIDEKIRILEAKIAGSPARPGIAVTRSAFP